MTICKNKQLEEHINDRINKKGHKNKHVDSECNGWVFSTYTRNSDSDNPDWHCNHYIDICAIAVYPPDYERNQLEDSIERIHQHPNRSDVNTYITHLENWARMMDRELRFTEFGKDFAEVQYFVDRGYKLRYRDGDGTELTVEDAKKKAKRKYWYVEAYKQFGVYK